MARPKSEKTKFLSWFDVLTNTPMDNAEYEYRFPILGTNEHIEFKAKVVIGKQAA